LKETMDALNYLVEQWLVKYIGVSNFSVQQIQEAQQYSKAKIIVNQIPYNLATRNNDYKGNCIHMEDEIIPYCQNTDILIIAYRPIERWFLLQSNPLLDTLSKKYMKTKAQIALNRLISKKNIITISKSINPEHLKENLGAIWRHLDYDDMKSLDETLFESPTM
jgi:diketogulonate reductase-like aldo/keto reductase